MTVNPSMTSGAHPMSGASSSGLPSGSTSHANAPPPAPGSYIGR
jgi:hypothetical protein